MPLPVIAVLCPPSSHHASAVAAAAAATAAAAAHCSDISLLRSQLLQEVQAPYAAKCEALAQVRAQLCYVTHVI